VNIDLNDIVKFETEKVKKAIADLEQRIVQLDRERSLVLDKANLLRRLLKINESANGNQPSTSASKLVSQRKPPKFEGMTIKDAAIAVLKEQGGKAHGKVILDALVAGGVEFTGNTPMSSLTATLIRAGDTFERAEGEKNTWRLRN